MREGVASLLITGGLCHWNVINDPFNFTVITDKIRRGEITIQDIPLSEQYRAGSRAKT